MNARAFQSTPESGPAAKRQKRGAQPVTRLPWIGQPASSLGAAVIQRKPGCACGGGCPSCKEDGDDLHIHPKLEVGTPGDPLEQQADSVAELVMRMPAPVPRQVTTNTERPLPIHRSHDSSEGTVESVADDFLSGLGSGVPLDAATRNFFEPRFGADFRHVRVYVDGKAAASASAISARAYTFGENIVFGSGEYRPQTSTLR